MPEQKVESTRYKGRDILIGHPVKVLPSQNGDAWKHNSFDSLILEMVGKDGRVTGIRITDPKTRGSRFVVPQRVVPYLRNVDKIKERLRNKR